MPSLLPSALRTSLRRHDLVAVRRDARFQVLGTGSWPQVSATAAHETVRRWLERRRPLVVTRQACAPQATSLTMACPVVVALTTPAAEGRQRLACAVDADAITGVRPALALSVCLSALDARSAATLTALERQLHALGARSGVYGSLAWEVITGEAYRHAASDVDLIVDVDTLAQFEAGLCAIDAAARSLVCTLDGELRFPGDRAVAWRELQRAQANGGLATVLAKGASGVELVPLDSLISSLRTQELA